MTCRAALLIACWVIWATSANAAQIKTGESGICHIRLEGEIEEGDADRLNAALQEADPEANTTGMRLPPFLLSMTHTRLCLNSKGGSYSEALLIIKNLLQTHVFTIVDKEHQCLSACAFIFLAGHQWSEYETQPLRVIDATARVGFHAPYLPVHGTAPDKVLSSSYQAGVKAVAELLTLDHVLFPVSLLAEALSHFGEDRFFMLTTLDQLKMWRIGLRGYKRPALRTEGDLQTVCRHLGHDEEVVRIARRPLQLRPRNNRRVYMGTENHVNDMCIVDVFKYSDNMIFMQVENRMPRGPAMPEPLDRVVHQSRDMLDKIDPDFMQHPMWLAYPADTKIMDVRE